MYMRHDLEVVGDHTGRIESLGVWQRCIAVENRRRDCKDSRCLCPRI